MVPNELFGSCVVSRQFASSIMMECSFQEYRTVGVTEAVNIDELAVCNLVVGR